MDTITERTIVLVCMRHGLINDSDEERLRTGNPDLDKRWAEKELPPVIERLRLIQFDDLLSGKLNRIYQTAYELRVALVRAGFQRLPPAYYHECLDAKTTLHEGVVYPEGVEEDLREYITQAHTLLREIVRRNQGDVTALAVMSGAVMIALRAIAQGRSFSSHEEMAAWAANGNGVEVGEIWSFRYTPKNGKLEEVPFGEW